MIGVDRGITTLAVAAASGGTAALPCATDVAVGLQPDGTVAQLMA